MDLEKALPILKDIAKNSGLIIMKYFESTNLKENTKLNAADIVTQADIESDQYIRSKFAEHFPELGIITEEGKNVEPKNGRKNAIWLCADPLDGTTNFSCGFPMFCVSIGVLDENFKSIAGVIYDPVHNEMFSAIKGKGAFLETSIGTKRLNCRNKDLLINCLIASGFGPIHFNSKDDNINETKCLLQKIRGLRHIGTCALALCYIAAGRIDGYYEKGPHIWDIAAGRIIVEESDGVFVNYKNEEHTEKELFDDAILFIAANKNIAKQLSDIICKSRENL